MGEIGNAQRKYLQLVEQMIEDKKFPFKGDKEEQPTFVVKVVKLNEFEKKIKDKLFIQKVISTLQELYEWKLAQYQMRIQDLVKQYEKDDRVIRRAKLTEEERKEVGMSSSSNLKLIYASLADTFDLVHKKYEELSQGGDDMIDIVADKFNNIVNDGEKGLKTLVGKQYESIKTNICTLLSSLEGGMNTFTKTFQNVVITGPAGVGKTTLAKYLAFYYNESGILATDIVNVITRPDLVGQYLGETGMKTKRKMIDSLEGIIFIDEAYQLGGCPDVDAYGMESITEIVNFLDKYMALSIVIVAGYENEMNLCFFSRNEGLRRRFPNQFKLQQYEYYDLFMIFIKGCYKDLYEYYSLVAGNPEPNSAFNASMGFLEGLLKSFEYLNGQKCKRMVNQIDPNTGQYIKDPITQQYMKTQEDTSCYFQNQGGDVGILVSKFFNYYYTKNNPTYSFAGALIDLGVVKQVDGQKISVDTEEVIRRFSQNDFDQKFYESKKPVGKKVMKEFTIPDLTKIMGKPDQSKIDKIFSKFNIDKLNNAINGISGPSAYTSSYIKGTLQDVTGEVFTGKWQDAAQKLKILYNEWDSNKNKPKVVPPSQKIKEKIPSPEKQKTPPQSPEKQKTSKKQKAKQTPPQSPEKTPPTKSKKVKIIQPEPLPELPEVNISPEQEMPISPKSAQVMIQNLPKPATPLIKESKADLLKSLDKKKLQESIGGKGGYTIPQLKQMTKDLGKKIPANATKQILVENILQEIE